MLDYGNESISIAPPPELKMVNGKLVQIYNNKSSQTEKKSAPITDNSNNEFQSKLSSAIRNKSNTQMGIVAPSPDDQNSDNVNVRYMTPVSTNTNINTSIPTSRLFDIQPVSLGIGIGIGALLMFAALYFSKKIK